MNLVSIASHSIDIDALPECPAVLDVGCRGFDFSREIIKLRPGAWVVAMDPDPNITAPLQACISFLRRALVGDDRIMSNYAHWSTGEANELCDVSPHYAEQSYQVRCVNLSELMPSLGLSFFDLVKLDCEGSEFQILENWPGPIAGQISVEFHDWTGPRKLQCDEAYYARLFAGPLKDYEVLTHELTTVGPGPAWGHWDTVLRLRK